MADRVSSDHPTVTTIRATLTETPTGLAISVPDETGSVPAGEVVRVVLEGTERFARPERSLGDGAVTVRGIYETPDGARAGGPDGDRFPAWVEDHDVSVEGSVLLDVVEPSFLYGLRAPGETARYEAREPPAASLRSIAENLDT